MYAFIPRDAGFFSVFNFYIGCLHNGIVAYPYYNKEVFLKLENGKNQHFSYWTDSENCWSDYFEPIKFSQDDNNFFNIDRNFRITRGEQASEEFRIPDKTIELIHSEGYQQWRVEVNKTFNKFIRFNIDIESAASKIFYNFFSAKDHVIGVHYRHPSHFIESGRVYFQQYFDKIDEVLTKDSKIFLASDNELGIMVFKERYGDKVHYLKDVKRLNIDQFLEWVFITGEKKPSVDGIFNGKGYELHHMTDKNSNNKKETTDLLKEVICLSKCNHLVHTLSNISTAISYINPSLNLISIKGKK